ncbi:MFS transporter [Streptomyces chiangmaiensis]|uniref:MFS transporter n=1 Tax=Streptomyces chiangmaiensis TaxID=766497 RepID=A0ABU7FWX5_9ACTN|nr:MFS transporter [Streptomyces chiangmaiensis]MED7828596.1 MFS transporter [Streptomyces chiangmaiensis]
MHIKPCLPAKRISRSVGFWLLAVTLLAFFAAASAFSPLLVVYQHRWGFSPSMLTTIFAVYALGLLVALLTVGGLSDYVGRRPVLAGALIVEAASMVVFLTAEGVGLLLVARIMQGLGIGAAVGCIGAGLLDLQPSPTSRLGSLLNSAAPAVGLGLGALGSGVLVQYAPAPTMLVFALLVAVFLVLTVVVFFLPEPVTPRPGAWASLQPQVAVPSQARRAFLAIMPCLVATWAITGFYLSLVPSLAVGVLHIGSHLVGALALTTFYGAGAVASLLSRNLAPNRVMTVGCVALAAGAGLTLLALVGPSTLLFFLGTALAGAGWGSSLLGSFGALAALAGPTERAKLFASVYVVSYIAFGVPALAAGLVIPTLGLRATTMCYGAAVIALALLAVLIAAVRRRTARTMAAALSEALAVDSPSCTGATKAAP